MQKRKITLVPRQIATIRRVPIIAGVSLAAIAITLLVYFEFAEVSSSSAASGREYRLVGSGVWSNPSIWQIYNTGEWEPATTPPSSIDGIITIPNGKAVVITESITIDQVVVEKGGQLNMSTGTVTLSNAVGEDLIVNGKVRINTDFIQNAASTVQVNGFAELDNRGSHIAESANARVVINSGGRYCRDGGVMTTASNHWVINSGGIYQHNMDGGELPLAMWNNYSTCEITGAVVRPIGNMGQPFYNLSCNCPDQAAQQGTGSEMAFVIKGKKRMMQ